MEYRKNLDSFITAVGLCVVVAPAVTGCGDDAASSKAAGTIQTSPKNVNDTAKETKPKKIKKKDRPEVIGAQQARSDRRKTGSGLSTQDLAEERTFALLNGFTEDQIDSIEKRIQLKESFEKAASDFAARLAKAQRQRDGVDEGSTSEAQSKIDQNLNVNQIDRLYSFIPFSDPVFRALQNSYSERFREYSNYVISQDPTFHGRPDGRPSGRTRGLVRSRGTYSYQGKEYPLYLRPWDKPQGNSES